MSLFDSFNSPTENLILAIPVFLAAFAIMWALMANASRTIRFMRKRSKSKTLEEILPTLPIATVYEYYDFPVVYTTVGPWGDTYLNMYVDGDNNTKTFLCKKLSTLDEVLLKLRKLRLRDFWCNPKDGIFLVTHSLIKGARRTELIQKIPEKWMPGENVFLTDVVETPQKCFYASFQQHTGRSSARVSVKAAETGIFVCPIRDIECGGVSANWCSTCPKRAAR